MYAVIVTVWFFPALCVKVNVGHDFNVTLREHDTELCERDPVNKRLEHLEKVLGKKTPN